MTEKRRQHDEQIAELSTGIAELNTNSALLRQSLDNSQKTQEGFHLTLFGEDGTKGIVNELRENGGRLKSLEKSRRRFHKVAWGTVATIATTVWAGLSGWIHKIWPS